MMDLRKTVFLGAVASALSFGGVAPAQSVSDVAERQAEISALLEELADPELQTWESVENKLVRRWSESGSDTANLLLKRGEDAIEAEDYGLAVEHLTALTDHAPDFAEGWNARASAFFLMGEYGLALGDIQRALALNPSHFGALTGVGIMFEEMGEPELALKAMLLARTINPHRETVKDAIERLQFQLGESTL